MNRIDIEIASKNINRSVIPIPLYNRIIITCRGKCIMNYRLVEKIGTAAINPRGMK